MALTSSILQALEFVSTEARTRRADSANLTVSGLLFVNYSLSNMKALVPRSPDSPVKSSKQKPFSDEVCRPPSEPCRWQCVRRNPPNHRPCISATTFKLRLLTPSPCNVGVSGRVLCWKRRGASRPSFHPTWESQHSIHVVVHH